jgi:hypothetical protein
MGKKNKCQRDKKIKEKSKGQALAATTSTKITTAPRSMQAADIRKRNARIKRIAKLALIFLRVGASLKSASKCKRKTLFSLPFE